MLTLTAREITVIRVALILRLDRVKDDAKGYAEIKALLKKLWDLRRSL